MAQGGNATLSASANDATAYQWYRNGVPINGANNASHNITNFTDASHAGRYRVQVSNPSGTVYSEEADLHAAIPTLGGVGFDNFEDNSTDLAKWVANDFSRDANFTETNGTLIYSALNGGDASVTRVWQANAMPRDSNWTARVDVHLPALNLNAPEMLEIGLGVALQDHLDKTATLTLKRNATGWYFHAQSHGTGTADTNQTATNGAHASLRLRWDASNTLLYAEFDNNASDPHATWQPLHHWNLSANPTNWDLNNTSSFRIHLSGNSENLSLIHI